MATNNAVNAPFPLSATQGGTGVASPTQYDVPYANGAAAWTFAALTNGQFLIGSTGAAPTPGTITAGTGIGVTNAANSITISATGAGAFSWISAASGTQAMVANDGYYVNNGASPVAFTLPATAAAGTILAIAGFSAGGWTLAQNALQSIQYGDVNTTTGTGGSLASTNKGDSIELLCVVANTTWVALNSVGNITYV
jgi:hypothetical protein